MEMMKTFRKTHKYHKTDKSEFNPQTWNTDFNNKK